MSKKQSEKSVKQEVEQKAAEKDNKLSKQMDLVYKIVLIIGGIIGICFLFYNAFQDEKKSNPPIDANIDWMKMEQAYSVYGDKSNVQFRYMPSQSDTYLNGVALTALFTNKADYDRSVTKFSVEADSIIQDLSPDLQMIRFEDDSDPIKITLLNRGWGETGPLYIAVEGVRYQNDSDKSIADVTILKSTEEFGPFQSVFPGETTDVSFDGAGAINITWKDYSVETVILYLQIKIFSLTSNCEIVEEVRMEASSDGYVAPKNIGGRGGDIPPNYVIVVDVESDSWVREFPVYQVIPAKSTFQLPIYLFPTKSCAMSVKITFEMDDGEIIESEVLDQAKIRVPYYTELYEFQPGETLERNGVFGDNITVYFPYEVNDAVVDKHLIDF